MVLRGVGGVIIWMVKESRIIGQMRCKPCWILINKFQILIPAENRNGAAHNGEDGRYVETLIRE